jgi:hypothetical protein
MGCLVSVQPEKKVRAVARAMRQVVFGCDIDLLLEMVVLTQTAVCFG